MSYNVKDQDIKITGTGRTLNIERTCLIEPFSQVGAAISDLIGGFEVVGGVLIRVPPQYHPMFPQCRVIDYDVGLLSGQTLQYTGSPSTSGSIAFSNIALPYNAHSGAAGPAVLKIKYGLPTLEQAAANQTGQTATEVMNLCDETYDFTYRTLTQKNVYYEWEDGRKLPQEDAFLITKTFPQVEARIVRHYALYPPWDTVCKLMGKVNKRTFRLLNNTFPIETVRFDGINSQRKLTSAKGYQFYEITYKFMINPINDWIYSSIPVVDPVYNEEFDFYRGYVGWNRGFDFEKGYWLYLNHQVAPDPATEIVRNTEHLYRYDDDWSIVGTGTNQLKGFINLFNPRAT